MQRGRVFDIQKFSIHDGPGIRTTVFLKGCALRCLWCHNPESQERGLEISFSPEKCIGCGYCFSACPRACHAMVDGRRVYRRQNCARCGLCAEKCYAKAIEVVGRDMTVAEVLTDVLKDKPFYDTSGGGMTLSGGEPMAQLDFTEAVLAAAKASGLHTCVETAGFAPADQYERIRHNVDLFLVDYKETDAHRHREYTGADRQVVMDNLWALDGHGARVVLRCPIIPGLNDRPDHFAGIAATANALSHIVEVNLMPYHALGTAKRERLGKASHYHGEAFVDDTVVARWVAAVQTSTGVKVRRG